MIPDVKLPACQHGEPECQCSESSPGPRPQPETVTVPVTRAATCHVFPSAIWVLATDVLL